MKLCCFDASRATLRKAARNVASSVVSCRERSAPTVYAATSRGVR